MTRYFWLALLAQLRAGRALFALSVLGVALGVASPVSIQILHSAALGAFDASLRAVSGEADLSVLPQARAMPEELYAQLLGEPGIERAWPTYRIEVALPGAGRNGLQVLGLDLFSPRELPWASGAPVPAELADVLGAPGWCAVSPELAREQGWEVGEPFWVRSAGRRIALRVGALVDFRALAPLASTRLLVMDIAQAQSLFGGRGEIHQIDVVVREGEPPAQVAARLQQRLGPGVRVREPEQRRSEAAGLMGAFRLNLTALSLISVFVGGFLVYVSTQASLLRRRAELGLLRTLGATQAQALALIGAQVLGVALLGAALGVPLGYWGAALNRGVVSATLTRLYLLEPIQALALPPWLIALALGVALVGAASGAALPAWELVRSAPRELLAAHTLQERLGGGARWAAGGGALLVTAALGLLAASGREYGPAGFVLAFAVLLALPLCTPLVLQLGTRRLRPRRFGLAYGAQALAARLHTSAFPVAALAIAVAMLIGITIMIGSFRRTVDVWISDTLRADVYLGTDSSSRGHAASPLGPQLVAELGALPGVAHVDRLRRTLAYAGGRQISVLGVDMQLPQAMQRFALLSGDPERAAAALRAGEAVLISEPLARKAGLGVGDVLELAGPEGPLRFAVAGVNYDYSSELGGAALELRAFERAFGAGPLQSLALYLEPGADAERVAADARALAGEGVSARSNRALREEVFAIFDQTFAITRLLQGMSLLIAAAGITLTLIVLAREQSSELALYRSLGATRPQLFGVFLGKGLGMAGFGALLGGAGGTALALILIFLVNRAYFGWTIALHFPLGALLEQLAAIAGAAALASVYPALRASRTPARELSRESA